ncbi:MAG TPA: MerR family transcriptional regulator [Armatimonadetes bacterium]|nr:MerR family transcriptional regulator [Armatimonadota bacterium]
MAEKPNSEPVYVISVAARLVNSHPQTLRMYERLGLITPYRNPQNIRLYSDEDLARIRKIQTLTQELGVNLAGVEIIFNLLERIDTLQEQLERQYEEIRREVEQELRERLQELTGG